MDGEAVPIIGVALGTFVEIPGNADEILVVD